MKTSFMTKTITLSGNGLGKKQIKLNYKSLKKAVLLLRAVHHPLRQQIIQLLEQKTKLIVTKIYAKLRLEQSVASQHLAILRRAGIVDTKRDGKFIYYFLNKSRLHQISKLVEELAA